MNKALLLIGAIGVSILILANTLPSAESHSSEGKLLSHFSGEPSHNGQGILHDGCTNNGGKSGLTHFHDSDKDGVHDHDGTEREFCIVGTPPNP